MHIILIVVDTLRADHLGCYGYFRDTSPNIDKLAFEGVRFSDSHSTAIATGPGFTSIITGLYPIHHGCYVTPYNLPNLVEFDDTIRTFPELIWQRGEYTTCAFDNLMSFLTPMKYMARGFEYYINVTRSLKRRPADVTGGEINERLLRWIKEHANEDFFLFVHYWEPHTPYNQPEEYRHIFHHIPKDLSDLEIKRAKAGYSYVPGWGKVGELWEEEKGDPPMSIDLYDGEIRYLDALIGEVVSNLKECGIMRSAVIILTADHGEQLGQHDGHYGHGGIHEAVTHVPLIIWGPKFIPSGKVINGFAQQMDIAPTILELIGVEELPPLDGESLLPVIRGEKKARTSTILEDEEQRAYLEGKWKYIRDYYVHKEALYNIESDPCEVVNLIDREKEIAQRMRASLDNWVRKNLKGRPDPLPEAAEHWRRVWKEFFGREFPQNATPAP